MSAPKDTSMASPFASKLGTNYCPLDDEVLQIRALLKAPLSRLKQLDEQIAELQKAIDELAEERERVRSFVDPHKDLISPFRRLPLDVIQEIFVACLPTHRNCVMTAVEAPVLLGRICSAWRSISLGTPRLWARLHIVEPSRSGTGPWIPSRAVWEEKFAQRLETTKTWLGRSGQCPLSISFQGSHDQPLPDAADPLTNTRLFMDTLLSVAPRWEEVSLRASTPALEMLSSITEHDVPLLQRFEMSLDRQFSNGRPNFALLGAQHLKQLSVSGSAVRNIRGLPVRWEDLTHLSALGFNDISLSYSGVLELLAKCSQLRECRLCLDQADNSLSQTDGFAAHNSIQLPFLHYFHISCFGLAVDGIGDVFRRLSLPKLRNLELRSYPETDFNPGNFPLAEVLIAFLAVSSCFEGLTIDTQQFTSPSLVTLFRGLPQTTTSLRIADRIQLWNTEDPRCVLDDAAIAVLIPTPENSGACPALQELFITNCTAPSDAVLLQFLKARMAVPASPLKKVKIKFARERQFDIIPDIQPFLDDGRVEVSPIYPNHSHSTIEVFSPWQGLPDAPGNVWAQDEFR
ncbi:hypothetical protein C8R46DRAFT_991215 [Mycena filopes]|nr:hypothetical protein C8R46DRAFT_991215 [Mycena filopes]